MSSSGLPGRTGTLHSRSERVGLISARHTILLNSIADRACHEAPSWLTSEATHHGGLRNASWARQSPSPRSAFMPAFRTLRQSSIGSTLYILHRSCSFPRLWFKSPS
ncbi:hypothetical protein MPTK1_6g04080 [Marchantia polymorpha subsp. ruderalis]|uniref:Uncharacterized protein n=2 Tax=Marchantia polymorpha TaxID=3197 RepID=A0AAF6BNC6_MARPO|nr:hypothetical protein MARPO_0034s0110 [Marchantia polymorpha]BBN13510.1 hypothetical protein Mp_6g04080 [Marchantia polymorpha subsp. ruderalis]|eukprot:PTQ41530.1 hypothetical protein MARPO_0034s0110 [Marchantia polymorpha]